MSTDNIYHAAKQQSVNSDEEIWKQVTGIEVNSETRAERIDVMLTSHPPEAFETPPMSYLIEPEITLNRLHLFTGKSGHGKSMLMLQWAIQVALTGRDVLICDLENSLAEIKTRMLRFGGCPPKLKYWGGWFTEYPPSLDVMEEYVTQKMQAPLIVIDSFKGFSEGVEENDNTQVYDWYRRLRRLQQRDCTVVVLHNIGKDDGDCRGASSQKDAVDVALRIDSKFDEAYNLSKMVTSPFKARGGGWKPVHYTMVDGIPARTTAALPRDRLIEYLKENDGQLTKEKFENAAALKFNFSRKLIREFIQDAIGFKVIDYRNQKLHVKLRPQAKERTAHLDFLDEEKGEREAICASL